MKKKTRPEELSNEETSNASKKILPAAPHPHPHYKAKQWKANKNNTVGKERRPDVFGPAGHRQELQNYR